MITTLFRTFATPLAVVLDHVIVPRRTYAFFDLSEELSCGVNSDHGTEVAR